MDRFVFFGQKLLYAILRFNGFRANLFSESFFTAVSGQVKRASIGGALFMFSAAAVLARGPIALCLAGGAVAASGENNDYCFTRRTRSIIAVLHIARSSGNIWVSTPRVRRFPN